MDARMEQVIALSKSGLSNRSVAKALGVSHTLINRWLKDFYAQQMPDLTDLTGNQGDFPMETAWKPLETRRTNSMETTPPMSVKQQFEQANYLHYAEQMDVKLKLLLDQLPLWQGRYVAKTRIQELYERSVEDLFSWNFNTICEQYPYKVLFDSLLHYLEALLHKHKGSYQVLLTLPVDLLAQVQQVRKGVQSTKSR